MNKIFLSFVAIFSILISADNVKPGEETGEFHYFNVTDPVSFIKALDKHNESDCAKKWQMESGAEVVVMGVLGSVHTHFVYVGYENNTMLERGRSIVGACEETAILMKSLAASSVPSDYVSRLGEQSLEVGDWTNDKFFMKYDFNVKLGHASHYANEWTKLMNILEATNSAGLITHRAGSGWMSHFVYIGGDSIEQLYSTFDANSKTEAFQEFSTNVSEIRELRNVSLISPVKAYPSKR